MKICKTCKVEKPFDAFYRGGKLSNGETRYRLVCKECTPKVYRLTEEQRNAKHARNKLWKEHNQERKIMHARRGKWRIAGIDPDLAEAYFLAHDGKCEICGETSEKTLSMDHDHRTGKIRGMLCNNCNTGLGMFKDSPRLMVAAIDYINSHNHQS